jgi:DNA-binding NtrC family response regulator
MTNGGTLRANVERYEAELIREALEHNGGNKSRTASELGLSRRSFLDKLIKYGMH